MSTNEAIKLLRRRQSWLQGRVAATTDRDLTFDKAEASALTHALAALELVQQARLLRQQREAARQGASA